MRLVNVILLLPILARADILRVPADFATIQGALNAGGDFDTILVQPGTYAEALTAPPHSFILSGDIDPNFPEVRPVIDPSSLPDPLNQRCLSLLNYEALITDFGFRNGSEMYGERPAPYVGGIYCLQGAPLTIRRCDFDSTWWSIGPHADHLTLDQCRFRNFEGAGVTVMGTVNARTCLFESSAYYSITFSGPSTIEECIFRGNSNNSHMIIAAGDNIDISDCVFGPATAAMNYVPLSITGARQLRLHGNVFTGMTFTSFALAASIDATCNGTVQIDSNTWSDLQNGGAMSLGCSENGENHPRGFIGSITSNLFEDCSGNVNFKAVIYGGHADLSQNHFVRLVGPAAAVSVITDSASELDRNRFDSTDYAVETGEPLDARWNWWGDSSGPYHPTLNPDGLGDEISDNVLFEPWYPDTSFLASPHPRVLLPQQVLLDVYPNPFNASATIILAVNQPGIFQIDLFNLLGQHVQKLWSGAIVNEKQILFSGAELPSGLYFVRVWQPIENRPVALQKVVIAK